MLKYAKPINILTAAPVNIQISMTSWVEWREAETELRADIADRFNYPSLWAAIDRLIHFVEERTKDEKIMLEAGYTCDDAFTLKEYEKQQWDEKAGVPA